MKNQNEEKNDEKIPILWQVFRYETGYIVIPAKIIYRIKEKLMKRIRITNL